MGKKPRAKKIEDPVARELDAIKRLLILQLYKSGVSQAHVAKALAIDAAELSRVMPAREFADNRKKSRNSPRSEKDDG